MSPHGGPVDTSFEAAMHLFKNGGFAASVPGFTKALELFPGHFLASRNLAIAKQRAASGVTASGTQGNGAAPEATAADDTSGSGLGWLWPGLLIAIDAARRRGRAGPRAARSTDARRRAGRGPGPRAAELRWPAASWRARVTGCPAVGRFPGTGCRSRQGRPRLRQRARQRARQRPVPAVRPRPDPAHGRTRPTGRTRPCCVAGGGHPLGSTPDGGAALDRVGCHGCHSARGRRPRLRLRQTSGARRCSRPATAPLTGRPPRVPRPATPLPARRRRSTARRAPARPHRGWRRTRHRRRTRSTRREARHRCHLRDRGRHRGSAPPAAGASRRSTSSVGGAVNPSVEMRTSRRCDDGLPVGL